MVVSQVNDDTEKDNRKGVDIWRENHEAEDKLNQFWFDYGQRENL